MSTLFIDRRSARPIGAAASWARRACAALPILALAACATITTGTSLTLKVESYPAGAACEAQRDGATVGMIGATPGALVVEKSWSALTIVCKKDGYHDATERLTATAQPASFGNVLLGGGVGLIVDAASGAMVRYEDPHPMLMVPKRFASVQARDDFFAGAAADLRKRADAEIDKMRKTDATCSSPTMREQCTAAVKDRAEQRDAALAALEQKRQATQIEAN